jgi:histidine kinase/DNA gyrase B/HSP90-like ATPase
MTTRPKTRRIKPGITARGFITAVKDYTEPAVVEEIAANSYDADASTVVILLDPSKQQLHIVDDGIGFSRQAIESAAQLGGGDKRDVEYSASKRSYLGAYGFGLKSTVKIANVVTIQTISADGQFKLTIDWRRLEQALKDESQGFELSEENPSRSAKTGTHIVLDLKNPTKELLDAYHAVLSNLPDDSSKCRYYTGLLPRVRREMSGALVDFRRLKSSAGALARKKLLSRVSPSDDPDLRDCEVLDSLDKQDKSVKCRIYFAGIEENKVRPLKKGLRGIYVRVQGRLLKQSFDDQKYVYGISKWVKFASGLRVELTIDWVRNEISLSREGLTFSNPKLEEQFRATLARNISAFIAPQLKLLARKAERHTSKKRTQRLELARRRSKDSTSNRLRGVRGGFTFKPETDGELALLLANDVVLKRVNPSYRLIDYNDQADIDCVLYDTTRRDFVFCELEPTLIEFLQHKQTPEELKLVVTWSLGKWRMGARKKGLSAFFQLTEPSSKKKGHYRLLAFSGEKSKKPNRDYEVVALDDLFQVNP